MAIHEEAQPSTQTNRGDGARRQPADTQPVYTGNAVSIEAMVGSTGGSHPALQPVMKLVEETLRTCGTGLQGTSYKALEFSVDGIPQGVVVCLVTEAQSVGDELYNASVAYAVLVLEGTNTAVSMRSMIPVDGLMRDFARIPSMRMTPANYTVQSPTWQDSVYALVQDAFKGHDVFIGDVIVAMNGVDTVDNVPNLVRAMLPPLKALNAFHTLNVGDVTREAMLSTAPDGYDLMVSRVTETPMRADGTQMPANVLLTLATRGRRVSNASLAFDPNAATDGASSTRLRVYLSVDAVFVGTPTETEIQKGTQPTAVNAFQLTITHIEGQWLSAPVFGLITSFVGVLTKDLNAAFWLLSNNATEVPALTMAAHMFNGEGPTTGINGLTPVPDLSAYLNMYFRKEVTLALGVPNLGLYSSLMNTLVRSDETLSGRELLLAEIGAMIGAKITTFYDVNTPIFAPFDRRSSTYVGRLDGSVAKMAVAMQQFSLMDTIYPAGGRGGDDAETREGLAIEATTRPMDQLYAAAITEGLSGRNFDPDMMMERVEISPAFINAVERGYEAAMKARKAVPITLATELTTYQPRSSRHQRQGNFAGIYGAGTIVGEQSRGGRGRGGFSRAY